MYCVVNVFYGFVPLILGLKEPIGGCFSGLGVSNVIYVNLNLGLGLFWVINLRFLFLFSIYKILTNLLYFIKSSKNIRQKIKILIYMLTILEILWVLSLRETNIQLFLFKIIKISLKIIVSLLINTNKFKRKTTFWIVKC